MHVFATNAADGTPDMGIRAGALETAASAWSAALEIMSRFPFIGRCSVPFLPKWALGVKAAIDRVP